MNDANAACSGCALEERCRTASSPPQEDVRVPGVMLAFLLPVITGILGAVMLHGSELLATLGFLAGFAAGALFAWLVNRGLSRV